MRHYDSEENFVLSHFVITVALCNKLVALCNTRRFYKTLVALCNKIAVALCNNILSQFVIKIAVTFCNNKLSHFVIKIAVALCNDKLSHFVIWRVTSKYQVLAVQLCDVTSIE